MTGFSDPALGQFARHHPMGSRWEIHLARQKISISMIVWFA
jgi:hypothetical protein